MIADDAAVEGFSRVLDQDTDFDPANLTDDPFNSPYGETPPASIILTTPSHEEHHRHRPHHTTEHEPSVGAEPSTSIFTTEPRRPAVTFQFSAQVGPPGDGEPLVSGTITEDEYRTTAFFSDEHSITVSANTEPTTLALVAPNSARDVSIGLLALLLLALLLT